MKKFGIYGAGGFGRQLVAQHRQNIGLIIDDNLVGGTLAAFPLFARQGCTPKQS